MIKLFTSRKLKLSVAVVFFVTSSIAMAENANAPWKQMGAVSNEMPNEFKDAVIKEQMGAQVDPKLTFTDSTGKKVMLGDFFIKKKPIILSLVYFDCPSLCNLHLNGLTEALKGLNWAIGNKFEVLSVSIEPKETSALAASKKAAYLKEYGKPDSAEGWHFLTGEEPQIKELAKEVGFGYKWDATTKQYAHSSAAIILTPDGKISRYLHGITFDPKTIRLSLVEASNGVIGELVDHVILFCYQYDPNKRTYAFYAFNIMRAGAAVSALALFSFLFLGWRKVMKEESKQGRK